ncbi:MAG: CHASE domain-containing protein [Rhodobacter sp.]|nr:CHASE domain-containing protein [Rhodobacter sp.]
MAAACLGLVLSLILPFFSLYYSHQRHNEAAQATAGALTTALQLRLSLIENQIAGAAGFLAAGRHIDAATYANYMRKTTNAELDRALRAVAFMPALRRSDLPSVERFIARNSDSFAAEGYPAFSIFPETENEELFPVLLVEPARARLHVFGFDLASNPERLELAKRALKTGRTMLTGPLALSQDSNGAPVSLLLIAPVEMAASAADQSGLPTTRGVVAVGVTPVEILEDLLGAVDGREMRVGLLLGNERHPGLALDRAGAADGETKGFFRHLAHARPAPISFGGRVLRLEYSEVVGLTARELANAVALFLLSLMATSLGVAYRWRQAQVAGEIEARLAQQEEELRRSNQIIAQAQKQEALGNLVGGVAHDFNNLLAVVLGNAELLDEDISAAERDECMRQIKMATERGGALSRQLLSFGRRALLEPGRQDVGAFVGEMESMLHRVMPETIALCCWVSPGTAPIFIDRSQLDTAVLNLAINARDAMPNGGRLTIEARNVVLGADFAQGDEELAPGVYVRLAVHDTGHGMTPEMAAQAFDPFFTTKPVGQGSGLGLSMVLGFVRQSGGTLRLDSQKARGTTVELYFAALEAEGETVVTMPRARKVAGRGTCTALRG